LPPRIDFTSQRLFIDLPMTAGALIPLDKQQMNYLINVLRMKEGDGLLVFNGISGEWQASLTAVQKKSAALTLLKQTRPQSPAGNIWLCFAPIKSARLDYVVQKAVEMGASMLIPMITNRTQGGRGGVKLNLDRMRANMIEAAEQCGVLAVPELSNEIKLADLLPSLTPDRTVIFCDEAAELLDPYEALNNLPQGAAVALLIGPEGGFDGNERKAIFDRKPVIPISLGPRILRADTAAVAALTLVQIACGDWK
jgi:16S rRNA (uracil1498-N3)-methyltransferase